jgi:hypothetical protein
MTKKHGSWYNGFVEANAEETNCVFMSCEQNAAQCRDIKVDNKSFESVTKFKYLEKRKEIQIAFMKKLRTD